MKIKAIHSFGIAGKHIAPGETVDAPDTVANDLIVRGRAVPVRADAPAEKPVEHTPKDELKKGK